MKYLLSLLLFIPVLCFAQREVFITEGKLIRDGFHIAPLVPTTKGLTFGAGYSRPVSPKMLFHSTLCYMPFSTLNGNEINTIGFALTPSLLYLPGRTDNYKGIIVGVEMPIMYYTMRLHDWKSNTSVGQTGTVVYSQYNYVKANALQAGLGARFGFRTQKRNHPFFWQPSVSFGVLAQKLFNYVEDESRLNTFGIRSTSKFEAQNDGFAPYAKLELAFGLYRFKKQKIKELEL